MKQDEERKEGEESVIRERRRPLLPISFVVFDERAPGYRTGMA